MILCSVLLLAFQLKVNCQNKGGWLTKEDEDRIEKKLDSFKVVKKYNKILLDSIAKSTHDSSYIYKERMEKLKKELDKYKLISKGYRGLLDKNNNKIASLESFKRKVWISPTERKIYWCAMSGLTVMIVFQVVARIIVK